ncbi:MAG: hypothetical protein KAI69_04715 [Deltaproteobacteria bacterium]|nr:hypothetical protein [Deltaproteobacteria bacterium]
MEKIKSKQEGPSSKQIDWAGIRKEHRAGQLSLRECARQFGISEGAIRKHAKKHEWGNRLLAKKVRDAVREKLVRNQVRIPSAKQQTDEEIVDEVAERGFKVVTLHRADIDRLREMEQTLLAELGNIKNPPTKLHICQFQGEVTQTVVRIPVTERAAALNNLANVQHKRIALERIAWSLDEINEHADKLFIDLS